MSPSPLRFSASYDRTAKVISVGFCAGLLLVAAALQSLAVGAIAVLVLLVTYAWSPRGYLVSGDSIIIERWIGAVRVPIGGLREARLATNDDFRGCIRLWASGGLFGYFGVFRTSRLGTCRWYVTDRGKAIVVRTEDRVTVLSPDQPEALLHALHPPAPEGEGPLEQTLLSLGTPNRAGAVLGVVVGVLALAAVTFAMLYTPGPPRYTLTSDALVIHDRFYPVTLPADAVDVGGIEIIDLAAHPEWRPTLRTNGFSNAHYHSGWYRVGGGKTIRLYRADGTRLVLLPPRPGGSPILMEVPDPERFVDQVRRAWSKDS